MLFHQDNTPAHTSSQALAAVTNSTSELLKSPITFARFSTEWLLFVSTCEEIFKRMQIYRQWGRYMRGKWLAIGARTIILLQQNPFFRESLDQVHISCRRPCWKKTKHGVHTLWLTVSGYELL